jgi:ABC-type transport system involved in multi-copper enzyme maturation permease subunit
MNIFPIIIRELRAEARHPANYAIRTFGATILTAFLAFFLLDQDNTQSGGNAFRALTLIIFCAIWMVVPLLTADCLSREKREGTLGLLFLTPLKPIEIVLGKGTIHAIRSLTLLMAGIPILAIPFVLGGITRANVFWSLLLNLASVLMALAAGLLASSLCRQWTRAIILAELFSVLFLFVSFKVAVMSVFGFWGWRGNLFEVMGAAYQTFLYSSRFQSLQNLPASGVLTMEMIRLIFVLVSVVILFVALVVLFASRRMKNTWQENPPSARQLWMREIFCTPRFWVGYLRRSSQNKMSRNPIGWLQQYSWSARLSKWGWCAVVISFVSWLLANDYRFVSQGCAWLKTAILISMAFSAVGSFKREKQNGALELLLVTPLRENQIIFGRLRGIWGQFLAGFLILVFSALSVPLSLSSYYRESGEPNVILWLCQFLAVPMVGLYFALRIRSLVMAWLLTCAVTLILPLLLGRLSVQMFPLFEYGREREGAATFFQFAALCGIAIFAIRRLSAQIKNRTFALGRT